MLSIFIGVVLCCTPNPRKEYRSLSSTEQQSFLDAVVCLKQKPSKWDTSFLMENSTSRYDDFVALHIRVLRMAHSNAIFLPWHRLYLHYFEKALRDECNYQGSLPYWDWTRDAQQKNYLVLNSFGGDGTGDNHCINAGPFSNWKISFYNNTNNPDMCISRDYSSNLPLEASSYDEASVLVLLDRHKNYEDFYSALDGGPHATIHNSIGGLMPMIRASANDPIFFLHHVNVDRIWGAWQRLGHEREISEMEMTDPIKMFGLDEDRPVSDVLATDSGNPLCYVYDSYEASTNGPSPPPPLAPPAIETNEPKPSFIPSTSQPWQPSVTSFSQPWQQSQPSITQPWQQSWSQPSITSFPQPTQQPWQSSWTPVDTWHPTTSIDNRPSSMWFPPPPSFTPFTRPDVKPQTDSPPWVHPSVSSSTQPTMNQQPMWVPPTSSMEIKTESSDVPSTTVPPMHPWLPPPQPTNAPWSPPSQPTNAPQFNPHFTHPMLPTVDQPPHVVPQRPTAIPGQCSRMWGQCGGIGWHGPTSCCDGVCEKQNEWYSQCLPGAAKVQESIVPSITQPLSTQVEQVPITQPIQIQQVSITQQVEQTTPTSESIPQTTPPISESIPQTTPLSPLPTVLENQCVKPGQQCGGIRYHGPSTCCVGTCQKMTPDYSKCMDMPLRPEPSHPEPNPPFEQYPGGPLNAPPPLPDFYNRYPGKYPPPRRPMPPNVEIPSYPENGPQQVPQQIPKIQPPPLQLPQDVQIPSYPQEAQGLGIPPVHPFAPGTCSANNEQCGGQGYNGPKRCCQGSCIYLSPLESRCISFPNIYKRQVKTQCRVLSDQLAKAWNMSPKQIQVVRSTQERACQFRNFVAARSFSTMSRTPVSLKEQLTLFNSVFPDN